jgi:hypothetical protein
MSTIGGGAEGAGWEDLQETASIATAIASRVYFMSEYVRLCGLSRIGLPELLARSPSRCLARNLVFANNLVNSISLGKNRGFVWKVYNSAGVRMSRIMT